MSSTLTKEILSKYAREFETFIETGTARGDGLQVAIDFGFVHLYSVEVNGDVFAQASARFAHNDDVLILHDNSPQAIENLLHGIQTPVVFWLDAHHSTGEPALPHHASPCPLLAELEVIGNHPVKEHLIIIDDCRYFWGAGIEQWNNVRMLDIVGRIMSINRGYWFSFEPGITPQDILVAKCGER